MSHNLLDLSLQTPPIPPYTCIEMMSAYLWITDSMEYDKLEKEMSVVQSVACLLWTQEHTISWLRYRLVWLQKKKKTNIMT